MEKIDTTPTSTHEPQTTRDSPRASLVMRSSTNLTEDQMTEFERMDAGHWYDPRDPEISAQHQVARRLCRAFNSAETDEDRAIILAQLVGKENLGRDVYVAETFQCDFPGRLILGDNVFFNYGCKILNCGTVTIGEEVRFGPNVTVVAVKHPLDGLKRNHEPGNRASQAFPVTIGARAWICTGAVICPGVRIGEDAVILANAVVTTDVPAGAIYGGQPAKHVRWTPNYDEIAI